MLYLANPTSSPAVHAAMRAHKIGMLDSPRQKNHRAGRIVHAARVPWAADNGCYSDAWNAYEWWSWLYSRPYRHRDTCLFATAPDVVGDADATAERSDPWLAKIRAHGYPVAYVAQNGLRELEWDRFDVLFIGGDDTFKIGPEGARWIEEATDRGVPVHMGRVNGRRRWEYARNMGCTTVDGTYLRFAPDKLLPDILEWGSNVSPPSDTETPPNVSPPNDTYPCG